MQHSHSHTTVSRPSRVSRLEGQQGTETIHRLESQGQCCQQARNNNTSQPHTNWRAKVRHLQQAKNTAMQCRHLHSGEPSTGIINQQKMRGTQLLTNWRAKHRHSQCQKHTKILQPLTAQRTKDKYIQQARKLDRHYRHLQTEEARTGIISRLKAHHSHSLPGEPRSGIVNRLKAQQGFKSTHILNRKSQGQSLSA